jgi:hypothetical protein
MLEANNIEQSLALNGVAFPVVQPKKNQMNNEDQKISLTRKTATSRRKSLKTISPCSRRNFVNYEFMSKA